MHLNVDIHNYYEHLVVDHITAQQLTQTKDNDFIADLCCLALSQLPARYIRHDIDMAFFLSSEQRHAMAQEVKMAIDKSLNYLESKARD